MGISIYGHNLLCFDWQLYILSILNDSSLDPWTALGSSGVSTRNITLYTLQFIKPYLLKLTRPNHSLLWNTEYRLLTPKLSLSTSTTYGESNFQRVKALPKSAQRFWRSRETISVYILIVCIRMIWKYFRQRS